MARGGNLEFAERERNRSFAADHQVDDYLRRNLSPSFLSLPLFCLVSITSTTTTTTMITTSTINIGKKVPTAENTEWTGLMVCGLWYGLSRRRLFLFEHPRKIWTLRWSRLPFGSIGVVVDYPPYQPSSSFSDSFITLTWETQRALSLFPSTPRALMLPLDHPLRTYLFFVPQHRTSLFSPR